MDVDAEGIWVTVRTEAAPRRQGWKLHISATVLSWEDVLKSVLPILAAEAVRFKVATPYALHALNQGTFGVSQIGKFITIYPSHDTQAVRLAKALDDATRGLPGPAVPSDRPLHQSSLVHYRYGTFTGTPMTTRDGSVEFGLVRPDGTIGPDVRTPYYQAPDHVDDPFLAASAAAPLPARTLIGNRFVITSTLDLSARGSLHTALDAAQLKPYVLKRAGRDACVVFDGPDAQERLRREFDVLSALAGDARFPAVYDLIEQDGDLYLIMEDVRGETLAKHVRALYLRGLSLTQSAILRWAGELAAAVERVHEEGYLLCDLKPENIMVEPAGTLRILDFDAVRVLGEHESARLGTTGFVAPERLDDQSANRTTDVYGLGAVLYFALSGARPFQPATTGATTAPAAAPQFANIVKLDWFSNVLHVPGSCPTSCINAGRPGSADWHWQFAGATHSSALGTRSQSPGDSPKPGQLNLPSRALRYRWCMVAVDRERRTPRVRAPQSVQRDGRRRHESRNVGGGPR